MHTSSSNYKASIKSWNHHRFNKNLAATILEKEGNKFSFIRSSNKAATIHIYIGCNNSHKIDLHFIDAKDDFNKNFQWFNTSQLSNKKHPLPSEYLETTSKNPNAISWKKANKRINRWIDNKKRDKWLTHHYHPKKNENNIFQVFVVNALDFKVGNKHDCYLALRKVIKSPNKYVADLIIVNTNTSEILNLTNSNNQILDGDSIDDMARPVPPFGSDYNDFGVLVALNIQ